MARVRLLTAEDMGTIDSPPPDRGDSKIDLVCLEAAGARIKDYSANCQRLGDTDIKASIMAASTFVTAPFGPLHSRLEWAQDCSSKTTGTGQRQSTPSSPYSLLPRLLQVVRLPSVPRCVVEGYDSRS